MPDANFPVTPEAVALELTKMIAKIEGKSTSDWAADTSRGYILDLYAECLSAARGQRPWPES